VTSITLNNSAINNQ